VPAAVGQALDAAFAAAEPAGQHERLERAAHQRHDRGDDAVELAAHVRLAGRVVPGGQRLGFMPAGS
jgi:hypothetical protein